MVVAPFDYPTKPHVRRHAPSGYLSYGTYKDWLRDEFAFRCVYCLERERWYPNGMAAFSADHIVPQTTDEGKKLICEYSNLVYACIRCNSARQDGKTIDPTVAAFAIHFKVAADGSISGLTTEGQDLVDLLGLDEVPIRDTRKYFLRVADMKLRKPMDADIDQVFLRAFSYPADLPDLTKYRPKVNGLKAGLKSCHCSLQKLGKLPQVY